MHEDAPFSRFRSGLSIFIFLGLSLALLVGMGPNLSSRLVSLGEMVWPSYAKDLRSDPIQPECNLAELKQRVAECPTNIQPTKEDSKDPFQGDDPFGDEDPFGDDDPFAEEGEQQPSKPPAVKPEADPFGGDDPFAEETEEDPFADEDPFAEAAEEDPFADEDPFVNSPGSAPKVNCVALQSLTERCAVRQAEYEAISSRLHGGVLVYRSVELTLGKLATFPYWKHLLVLLTLMGASCVTAARTHIALREPKTNLEYVLAQGTQLIVHLCWLVSCWADYRVQASSSATPEHIGIPILWALGFAVLAIINIWHLISRPVPERSEFSLTRALMVIPLYVYMGVIAAGWFTFGEGHDSGQAIYLHKYIQHPNIYLGIGLYIWAHYRYVISRRDHT